jgi:lysophospholipase L1-like esterase
MAKIAGFVLLIIVGLVLYEAMVLGVHLWRGRALAAESRPFERQLPGAERRVLILGDSTAVGTGAGAPAGSVAGRLASDFPGVEVINLAEDGARMSDVLGQLAVAPEGPVDVILIQIGGNDILRFTEEETLRAATAEVLQSARRRASRVVMMSTGDVGTAPAFMPPLSWILSNRTREVRELFLDLSAAAGIEYVDLYRPPERDPFLSDPDRYYAPDGLHPSGEGYRRWYEQLLDDTAIAPWLKTGAVPQRRSSATLNPSAGAWLP